MTRPFRDEPGDPSSETIAVVIDARPRDLGGFAVRRALPAVARRRVGPFVFFDHFGPVELAPGQGMDVRPHPHIALATVTFLFDGEIIHKDSLGSDQPIRPGDVNWMTAGRGIVHSERTGAETRKRGGRLHGLQSWVALPTKDEEIAPSFRHYPASAIPRVRQRDVELRIVVGRAYGAASPVDALSPTLYVEARIAAGGTLPVTEAYTQRAIYVIAGAITVDGRRFEEGSLIVLHDRAPATIAANDAAHVVLIGGESLDGERHIEWNFVSSSKERIERAKADWREGRFPIVPGDENERIPLPE